MTLTLTQVTHELKERERANQEKEDSLQVKRQTVELLPDAHNNLAKLQVRRRVFPFSVTHTGFPWVLGLLDTITWVSLPKRNLSLVFSGLHPDD